MNGTSCLGVFDLRIFTLLVVLLQSGCGSGSDPAGPVGAIHVLRDIHEAEVAFKAEKHRCGTLDELASVTTSEFVQRAAFEHPFSYQFKLVCSESGYHVRAQPIARIYTRSFYMDETGTIRHTWGTPPADGSSPVLVLD